MRAFCHILSLLFITIFCSITVFAQGQGAPESMNYQAVIRDGSGNVVANQTVSLRIKILQGSVSGSPVYVETFNPTTNAYGSIAIQIGTGSVITGTFNTIDWGANSHFVETAVDISGWSNYTVISTTQLMSVPYALHAKSSDAWNSNDNTNFTNKKVSVGHTNEIYPLSVMSFHDGSVSRGIDVLRTDNSGTNMGVPMSFSLLNTNNQPFEFAKIVGRTSSNTAGSEVGSLSLQVADGSSTWGTNYEQERMRIDNDRIIARVPLKLDPQSTAPSFPNEGDMYYDNNTDQVKVYNGSSWDNLAGGSSSLWAELSGNAYRTSGNIGIGTANPAWNLDIKSASTNQGGIVQMSNSDDSHLLRIFSGNSSDPNPFIMWKTGNPLRFSTSSGIDNDGSWEEHMRISSNGNVGIGTETPNSLLEISNENNSTVTPLLTLVNNDANNNYTGIRLMEGSSYNYGFSIMYDDNGTFGASNALTLLRHNNSSTGAPFMTALRSNGRIGFGTTNPNSLVEIKTENSSSIDPTDHVTEALRLVAEYANDWASNPHEGGVGVKFMLDNQNGNYWPTGEINFIGENSNNNEGHGGFQFKVNNNTAGGGGNDESTASSNTIAMVINHEGKVGIGTTSPTTNLHVEGSILVDAYSGGSGTKGIFFRDGFVNSNNYNSSILVYDHNSSGSSPDGLSVNGYDGVSFSTGSNSRNERMRISSDGNVGIGTETPNAKLEVSGTARITDLAGNGDRMVVADADGDLSTQAIPSAGSSMPNGSNNGDMMYWDGSAWQTIAVGSAGAVLQIIGGVPTWVSTPDITGPTITLNGNANMNVVVGGTFTDPGATTDEGTLTTSGTVDATTVGTYTITYSATDATGNTATATRTVAVYQSQFNYTGSAQTFTVPAGVTSISVDAYGASGMTATTSPNYGGNTNLGKGGRVQVDLTVTPGDVLNIYVGGSAHMAGPYYYNGGWNGGGNGSQSGCIGIGYPGGGATDIRIGGTALTDRVIVAGGGGGRGGSSVAGGHGGGLTGQNGSGGTNSGGPEYGTGGSQSSGGVGGYAWYGDGTPTYTIPAGSAGTLGQGGSAYSQCMSAGGGGGYYGGGAGFDYNGAGGGSSYTHPTLCSSVVHTQGVQTGSGQLIITIP